MNAGGRWFSSINKYGNCLMKKNFWSVFTLMNKRINWKLYVSLAQHISVDRGGLGTEVTHGNGSYQKLKDIMVKCTQDTRQKGASWRKQQCQCHKSCSDFIQGSRYLCARRGCDKKRQNITF